MIARTWRGFTTREHADPYHDVLSRTGVAACRATDGNAGVFVLRRSVDDRAEFLFISLWESMDAVRAFAGARPEEAVFFPEDDAYLIEREESVAHYDVLTSG